MVQRCEQCGGGPFEAWRTDREFVEGVEARRFYTRCKSCAASRDFLFDVSRCPDGDPDQRGLVSTTPQRSEIIDVAQWLMLFHSILAAASKSGDRGEARRLGFEAAQCLDEALKFYAPNDTLPPEDAFLDRQHFDLSRQHPEQFERARLIAQRSRLPSAGSMRVQMIHDDRKKKRRGSWWRRLTGRGDSDKS
jgi:hypothetical protein